jgi:transposase
MDLLEKLTREKIGDKDFEDNRLGRVLTRLSDDDVWLNIEEELWSNVIEFYELSTVSNIEPTATAALASVHIDFTATCGYHQGEEDGLMRFGKTKDYRSDLKQVKLAGASFGGHLLSTKVEPGNEADNPHYLSMIQRVRKIVKKIGILYAGDSKMADKNTRLTISEQGDYYLTRLPKNRNAKFIEECIAKGANGTLELIYRGDNLLGGGYEFTREQEGVITLTDGQNKKVKFTERVFVVRSINYGKGQEKTLTQLAGLQGEKYKNRQI